jgi:hypothetical protein
MEDSTMTTAVDHPPIHADETAVRGLFQQLLDAWGRGDGAAYAALFTEDADYVAFDGSRTVGRQAIVGSCGAPSCNGCSTALPTKLFRR